MVPLDLAGVLIGPRGTGKGCGHGIFRCQPRHRAGRRLGTVFAKLFYLSGVLNGRYPNAEIMNLSRFISSFHLPKDLSIPRWQNRKFLTSRTSIAECDRTVTLFNCVRGTNLRIGTEVHNLELNCSRLGDSCPNRRVRKETESEWKKKYFAPMTEESCTTGMLFV